MCKFTKKCLIACSEKALTILGKLTPLSLLAIRLWVANVFFKSALLKLPNGFLGVGEGNWPTTLMLFKYEHPVPYLNPELAAYMGTTVEFLAPIAFALGLGARIGATGLLVMVAVIEFTYQSSPEHIIWAIFLSTILTFGPGKLSADHLIRSWFIGGQCAITDMNRKK